MELDCDDCKQPDSCEARGCFKDRLKTVKFAMVPGGSQDKFGVPDRYDPEDEKRRAEAEGLSLERAPL